MAVCWCSDCGILDWQGLKLMTSTKLEPKVTIVNLQSYAGENVSDSYRLFGFYYLYGWTTFKLFSSNNVGLYLQSTGVLSCKILSDIFLKLLVIFVIQNMSIFSSISIHLFNRSITSSSQVNSYLLRSQLTDIKFQIVYGSSTHYKSWKSIKKWAHEDI